MYKAAPLVRNDPSKVKHEFDMLSYSCLIMLYFLGILNISLMLLKIELEL